MKRKRLVLSKQTLRILSNNEIRLMGGGGSLNCTNPTSSPLIAECVIGQSRGGDCIASGQPDCR